MIKSILFSATLISLVACTTEPHNRAVDAARFVLPEVTCQGEDHGILDKPDTAWCRTPNKLVFYCKQGAGTMLECKPYGEPPKSEAAPAVPPAPTPTPAPVPTLAPGK